MSADDRGPLVAKAAVGALALMFDAALVLLVVSGFVWLAGALGAWAAKVWP